MMALLAYFAAVISAMNGLGGTPDVEDVSKWQRPPWDDFRAQLQIYVDAADEAAP